MDEDAATELLHDLIEMHVSSPDREALHALIREWSLIVRAVKKLGLITDEDIKAL
jgi:hypothetical protein